MEKEKYPYFIVPDVLRYPGLDPGHPEAAYIRKKLMVNIGDTETLDRLIGNVGKTYSSQQRAGNPEENNRGNDSFGVIDAFLDSFEGKIVPVGYIPEEPQADTIISEEEETSDTGGKEETAGFAMENELKRLIKNHLYSDALRLIELQNLNNPEKSIYFAHQMRFLKKLMAIDNYRKSTKG